MLLVGALAWEEPDLKISNRNILLPVPQCEACRKVTYRLTARGGCYAWEISNPAVLELQEMRDSDDEHGCHGIALVTPKTQSPVRSPIWIIARDRKTSSILRCEVHIELIHHLAIIRQQRKVDVDDVQGL